MSVAPPPARTFPAALFLVLVGNVLWMGWLVWYAAMPATSDLVCFKQPAYMRLFTDHFSIPSYAGRAPSVDKFNSYPAAVYVYANYLAFKIAGFSIYSSTLLDVLIHLAVSGGAAWALWRVTGCQLPGIVFVVCSSQWLLPSGRPEELGMLFVIVALLTFLHGRWGLGVSIAALGLAGATSPGAAVVGTILLVSFDGMLRGFRGGFWKRATLVVLLSVSTSLALYCLYVWPYLKEAWEQDRILRANDVYAQLSIREIVLRNPRSVISTLLPIVGALFLSIYIYFRKPGWFPRATPAGAFVTAAAVAIAVGVLLNVAAQRPEYDYRHVLALSVASLAVATSWWLKPNGQYRPASWALAAGLILFSLPMQRDLVRHTVAPVCWPNDAISYAQARETIQQLLPPDASVGGDGTAWTLIDDGRPYLLTQTIAEDQWPEFVLSGTWASEPVVLQTPDSSRKLTAEYEEITPWLRTHDGCALHLLGLRVPVATGHCDWYVRVWKRRPAADSTPPQQPR